jgi:hypothetical protein
VEEPVGSLGVDLVYHHRIYNHLVVG